MGKHGVPRGLIPRARRLLVDHGDSLGAYPERVKGTPDARKSDLKATMVKGP